LNLLLLQATTSPPATDGNGLATIVIIEILIFVGILVIAAVATSMVTSLRRPDVGARGQSWLDYGNFFIVVTGIVAVFLAFLVAMLVSGGLFHDPTQLLAILTALFGVIGTLVGTYFGVKAGSDAAQGAQDLASGVITPTRPTVVAVEPPPNAPGIAVNTPVSATFSTDMNPATITNVTFRLVQVANGAAVSGDPPAYDQFTKRATFRPAGNLDPSTEYQATITTGVQDLGGNALPADFTWRFTTQ
jgi:hypothetical protein